MTLSVPCVNILGLKTPIRKRIKTTGKTQGKYFLFSPKSIASEKGITLIAELLCWTLAFNNSKSAEFSSIWSLSCNVLSKRSEILGKYVPIMLEAWYLSILFPKDFNFIVGMTMNFERM